MSGGSYDYLCYSEFPEFISENRINDMEQIEKRLIEKGYPDIAKDVRRLIEYSLSAKNRLGVLFDKLSPVFHAVEWYDSGDISEDTLSEELEKYRSEECNAD